MTDQKIDTILKEVYKHENGYILLQLKDFKNHNEYRDYRNLVQFKMGEELDLVRIIPGNKWIVSDKGKRISENNGWIAHVEREKDKERKISEKLDFDLTISKIRAKTFVPILVLGAIGGIYSSIKIGLLLYSLLYPKEVPTTTSQNKEPLDKLNISSSIPETTDSLINPNQKTDSVKYDMLIDSIPQEQLQPKK